jgi:ferredoxin
MIVKDWCSYCGECAGVCPRNLIQVREYALVFNDEDCKDCDTCIKACPIDALEKEE